MHTVMHISTSFSLFSLNLRISLFRYKTILGFPPNYTKCLQFLLDWCKFALMSLVFCTSLHCCSCLHDLILLFTDLLSAFHKTVKSCLDRLPPKLTAHCKVFWCSPLDHDDFLFFSHQNEQTNKKIQTLKPCTLCIC